jgi:glycosyltransferase involved in cell wall biosynthesis
MRMSISSPNANLLVVSHVRHYDFGGTISAYGPYTREIDIWADLFPQIVIASPVRKEAPPNDCLPFTRPNISLIPQKETGGDHWRAKLTQLCWLPALIWNLARTMRGVDAIHVRCPGNLGLLGVILAPLFSRCLVAKYAGQWNGYHGEPFSNWLQRRLLRSFWWRHGVVTVYGEWPNQPRQIVPFFTSMMTANQVLRSVAVARDKCLGAPVEILYSGRLASLKGVDVLLRAVRLLADEGVAFRLTIIGDGPEANRLMNLVTELRLVEAVVFTGALPFHEVMQWYEKGQILVLPSRHSEGWPKVLAEAMCHGLVCISTDHGLIPWLLRDRGYVFPVDDVAALATCLMNVTRQPDEYRRISEAAASWAQNYSLEGLRDSLRELLSRKWKTLPRLSGQART